MGRRLCLGAATALAGTALLVAASASGGVATGATVAASDAPRGGTFRILGPADFDHIDPVLAYSTFSWQMLAATQLRLFYYPMVDGPRHDRIEPMAAAAPPRV